METPEKLLISKKTGYTWIVLPDSIHMDNYRQIETQIMESLSGNGERVVLDLANTKNLFSSGLGLIIRLRKTLAETKGFICLVNLSKKIRELLESVHLDKVLPLYSTDVEFEISQDDVWQKRLIEETPRFIFLTQIEQNLYRINLSGQMTATQDLSGIASFSFDHTILDYVFDLTGLDLIDSYGVRVVRELFVRLHRSGARCVAYGANDLITELLQIQDFGAHVKLFEDEHAAIKAIGKV